MVCEAQCPLEPFRLVDPCPSRMSVEGPAQSGGADFFEGDTPPYERLCFLKNLRARDGGEKLFRLPTFEQ